jgi:hypothetical protein
MKHAWLCLVASVIAVGCGPIARVPTSAAASASRQTPSLSSTSATPQTVLPPSSNPSTEVLSVTTTNGDTTIHLLTISGGHVADRLLLAHQQSSVLNANSHIALMAANTGQFEILDLNTGTIRVLGVTSPWAGGPGALSPDGTKAAVKTRSADLTNYEIVVVDLVSGSHRTLLQVPISAYNRAGLDPVRWTNAGILVSPGRWDGPRFGLLNLDPQAGTLTPAADGEVDVLSPDATMIAAAGHADLGGVQFAGQGDWPNQLTVRPMGGPSVVIAQHVNRAFAALDVANDGNVIYAIDDAPLSTAPPAQDMGLYLETKGRSIQEFGEARIGQWQAATFLGGGTALVAQETVGGGAGAVEIDLVTLCESDLACTATKTPVETDSGAYPFEWLVVLNDPRPT